MAIFIDYFNFIVDKILEILDSLKMPNGQSILFYILGAIIIGFVIKLVKGSSNEFEHGMNFTSGYVVQNVASKYAKNHAERKKQILDSKAKADKKTADAKTLVHINPIHRDLYGGKSVISLDEMLEYDRMRNE